VLLVLLIIFMVTAPKSTVDLRLELPRSGGRVLALTPIVVDVAPDGAGGAQFLIGGRAVSASGISAAVLALGRIDGATPTDAEVRANAHVFVRADQSVAYARVVAAIDALQGDGFEQVGLFAQTAE
jgi:biopolymer transport protein ExbD